MQFPASVPVRALPGSAAAWARAAQQTRGYHYAAWGPNVLVDVHTIKLADVLPTLDFVFGVGERRRLPLNVIVFVRVSPGAYHEVASGVYKHITRSAQR